MLKKKSPLNNKKAALEAAFNVVENIGFEPITSSLPAKRSSQMS
jgi:hypothetical protein